MSDKGNGQEQKFLFSRGATSKKFFKSISSSQSGNLELNYSHIHVMKNIFLLKDQRSFLPAGHFQHFIQKWETLHVISLFKAPDNNGYRYYFFQHLSNKLGRRTICGSGNREYEKGDKKGRLNLIQTNF